MNGDASSPEIDRSAFLDDRRKTPCEMKACWWSAAFAMAVCGSAHAQSNAELKAMLEQALKTVQDLQARVKTLEQERAPVATAASPASAPTPIGAPMVAPATQAEPGTADAAKARVEVYGQAMIDAIHDFRRMDPGWSATLRPSKIPVTCPGDPGCGKD